MSLYESCVLGLVQGLTEFLPVSSSGHLVLLQNFFGVKDNSVLFNVLLHMATLFVIISVYFKDIYRMITKELRYLGLVACGVAPTLVIGGFGYKFFMSFFEGSLDWIGLFLIITGLGICLGEKRARVHTEVQNLNIMKAFLIGVVQSVAILPGISRSGFTIAAACAMGLDRKEAVKFSFILAIPSILGAFVLQIIKEPIIIADIRVISVGVLTAVVFGFLALKLLQITVMNKTWVKFAYYCICVGVLTLLYQFISA